MTRKLQDELLQHMGRLTPKEQERVLAFVRGLAAEPLARAGRDLVTFAGAIDPGDLQQMAAVIEEGCERVDESEW